MCGSQTDAPEIWKVESCKWECNTSIFFSPSAAGSTCDLPLPSRLAPFESLLGRYLGYCGAVLGLSARQCTAIRTTPFLFFSFLFFTCLDRDGQLLFHTHIHIHTFHLPLSLRIKERDTGTGDRGRKNKRKKKTPPIPAQPAPQSNLFLHAPGSGSSKLLGQYSIPDSQSTPWCCSSRSLS